jgi:isoamyl acetate esterase
MNTPPPPRPLFLLCGDSLTQDAAHSDSLGWGVWLQHAYIRSVDIINRGLCGYNTKFFIEQALPVLREELRTRFQPALITLWLGTNDASAADGSEAGLYLPLDQYKQNMALILDTFQTLAPQATILVITPAVIDDDRRREIQVKDQGKRPADPLDRTNAQIQRYAQACVEVATQAGVAVLDFHTFFMEQYPEKHNRARFFGDGVHLSREGNRVVYEQVKKRIETLVPKELLEQWQLPCFRTLLPTAQE